MSSGEQISPYREGRSDAEPAVGATGGTMTNEMADAYEISEAQRSRSLTRLGMQEVPDG